MDNSNYRKMYAILCGAASDAIDLLERVFQQALDTAEELYLSSENNKQTHEA